MKTKLWLGLALAALLGAVSGLGAQTTGAISVAQKQNLILLNGRPQVLLWARGLQDFQDIAAYKQAGFTALYIGVNGSDESLLIAKSLLVAAQGANLPVIIGLDSAAAKKDAAGGALAVNPAADDYRARVGSLLLRITGELKDNPNIIAWLVEGLTPEQINYSDADYRLWLQGLYQNFDQLNQAWSTDFTDGSQITLERAVAADVGFPGGLGRATLSVGLYYQSRYQELLNLWGNTLQQLDPQRLRILGGQADDRSLMATTDAFAGPVTTGATLTPAAAGGWQGIEAIDIARQSNYFAPFAFADVRSGVSGAALYDWAGQVLVHGAAGIGLDNWESIKGKAELIAAIGQIKARFITTGAFPQTPRAQTAFIYVPLAGGPEYGFLPQAASAEPQVLFQAFARGTRFGPVDYLSEDRLARTDLSGYNTIFAPLALAVYADSQAALAAYVQRGGVLVADWGFAANDAGSLNYLPEAMSQLFGIGPIVAYDRSYLDLTVLATDALFPSLPLQAQTAGREKGGAFAGLMGAVNLTTGKRFMSIAGFEFYVPSIVINPSGAGAAVFASAPLWENWQRGDGLFEAFHNDLLRRSPALTVAQTGLFPQADVVPYADNSFGLYRPADLTGPTSVQANNLGRRVYFLSSGYQLLSNNPALVFAGAGGNFARPLPLQYNPNTLAYLQVKEYRAQRLTLEIHGGDPTIAFAEGKVALTGGRPFLLSLTLAPGGLYNFAPGSRHRLTLQPLVGGPAAIQELVAGDNSLQINLSGLALTAILEPIE